MQARAAERDGTQLWVALLTGASVVTTLALACATPFAALAAIAATRLRARAGFALMGLSWFASQVIGFCILGYPTDPTTMAWGVAILTAALLSLAVARWGSRASGAGHSFLQLATAYGTGFLGYKLALLAWSFVLGGVHTALSPYWTAQQFGREALILATLVALHHAAIAFGLPAAGSAQRFGTQRSH